MATDMQVSCEMVTPLNMQFVNETEDIMSATARWNSAILSDDSDDGADTTTSESEKLANREFVDVEQIGKRKFKGPEPRPGKKTRGRVKIKMEYIKNRVRRYTTFSKRKTGMMKKVEIF